MKRIKSTYRDSPRKELLKVKLLITLEEANKQSKVKIRWKFTPRRLRSTDYS